MNKSKCCNKDLVMKQKGSKFGLYCSDCVKWINWFYRRRK